MKEKTFKVTSGRLIITDPCYKKGTWCSGVLENVANGIWEGGIIKKNEGDWGNRVAEIYAYKRGWKTEDHKWKLTKFDIGVDSGQAGIFDEALFPQDPCDSKNIDSFYERICDLTGETDKWGVIEFGVVSSSGFGDGEYDCFIQSDRGKVKAVKVVFISDSKDDSCFIGEDR